MGLCDRYKCGTFCEDYFKLRDQVTDALREPACRFAASRTKTILLSLYSDSQNARPHSPFSAPRWWLLNSSNGAVWSKVFYTRAPWQQVLREEGKKKSGGEYISHMGSCLSNSGFSFKTKTPELEALTGRRLAKKKNVLRDQRSLMFSEGQRSTCNISDRGCHIERWITGFDNGFFFREGGRENKAPFNSEGARDLEDSLHEKVHESDRYGRNTRASWQFSLD